MNTALNCIIVDDEAIARKSLEKLCLKSEFIKITSICESAEEALAFLEENSVDLLFLDVEMPGLSGMELMDKIGSDQQVILTTAKVEYAYEAFEYHVTDYLKKPISFPRFEEAVRKAVELHRQNDRTKTGANEIYIKEDGRLVRLLYDDILYIENAGDYVCIQTTTSKHIIYGTIRSLEARLPTSKFLKVHRSFIINLGKIKDIEDATLVIDRKVIPISRSHRNMLMNSLNLL
jgi:DNA-binding LytR/AlgR family response regulator